MFPSVPTHIRSGSRRPSGGKLRQGRTPTGATTTRNTRVVDTVFIYPFSKIVEGSLREVQFSKRTDAQGIVHEVIEVEVFQYLKVVLLFHMLDVLTMDFMSFYTDSSASRAHMRLVRGVGTRSRVIAVKSPF